jgi:hypothetical protein
MPWVISMPVLQPRISTASDLTGVEVGTGVNVSVGGGSVLVSVGGGVSVIVGLTGTISVTPGKRVFVRVGVKMIGVAVTMFGVGEGGTIQVGTG